MKMRFRAPGSVMARLAAITLAFAFALYLAGCATPAILGPDGKRLDGSVSELERVTLNGRKEWITVRGRRADAPILLFLAGGPGGSELATVRHTLGALEEDFLVVTWDQPGAGKSYGAIDHEDLTAEMYVEDAKALIDLLCGQYGQDKVFLLGESWGSALGLFIARDYPERLHAFFGTGQMVDFLATDLASYELILDWLRAKGDAEKVAKLERQGPPPYSGKGVAMKLAAFLMETGPYAAEVYGVYGSGDTWRDILSQEYGPFDKINWFRGLIETMDHFYPKLWSVDMRAEVPRLAVPAFFFMGRYDVNANVPIVEDYFRLLEAPRKELVWFERSGHTPWSSETALFVDRLAERAAAVMRESQ